MTQNYDEIIKTAEFFLNNGSYVIAINTLDKIQEADKSILTKKFNLLSDIVTSCRKAKDYQASLRCFLEMEKIAPDNEKVLLSIALTYEQLQKEDIAFSYYEKILSINKRNYDALIHIAILLIYRGDLKNVLSYIEKAKRAKPNQYKTAYAYYKFYEKETRFKEAMRYAKEMLSLKPDNANNYYYCADCSYNIFDYEKSIEYCDKYLSINPDNPDIIALKILCMKKTGKIDDITPLFEKLISDYPESYTAEKLYLMDILLNKDYEKAMKYYLEVVSCKKLNENVRVCEKKYLEYEQKAWRREDLQNKTLLVYQGPFGFGDYLMFSRYIPILEKKAGKVLVETGKNFFNLFKNNFHNSKVILDSPMGINSQDYDYSVSSMELLYSMNMNFDNIPNSKGWLNISENKINKVKETDLFNTKKRKIGLFWRGGGGLMKYRNMEIEKLVPLFELENCQFYSLDIEEKDKKILDIFEKYNIIDCSKYIDDAEDTGAVLKNLDIFISVDSFPLHLSGALSVKTFLVLPVLTEWRWFKDTETTLWYDSVKIFRQTEQENLEVIISRIKNELEVL